jgi:hypothetical protein
MTYERQSLQMIAHYMANSGLAMNFVMQVFDAAHDYEGVDDLCQLWANEPDPAERKSIESDLRDLLRDINKK